MCSPSDACVGVHTRIHETRAEVEKAERFQCQVRANANLGAPTSISSLFGSLVELREAFLQPRHCISPLWSLWLANRVLIPKQSDFINSIFNRDRIKPLHRDEVFAALWIVREFLVVSALRENV